MFLCLGIENSSAWFQPTVFQCRVEEPGLHIFRNTWSKIWNCAKKGSPSSTAKNRIYIQNDSLFMKLWKGFFLVLIIVLCILYSRVVRVECWHPFRHLSWRKCSLRTRRASTQAQGAFVSDSHLWFWPDESEHSLSSRNHSLLLFTANYTTLRSAEPLLTTELWILEWTVLLRQTTNFFLSNPLLRSLTPSTGARRKYLVFALAEILWRAGQEERATVAV